MFTPDEWAPPPPEDPHDHKGYSEERCVRCGWVMGRHLPRNCQNDDTPHRFPSQAAEIERLRAENHRLHDLIGAPFRCTSTEQYDAAMAALSQETVRWLIDDATKEDDRG